MANNDQNFKGAADDVALSALGPPLFERRIEGYRSLSTRGFVVTITLTATMLLLPLFAVLGTAVLWGLLLPALIALAALWVALRRNTQDGEIYEEIRLWPNLIDVTHAKPRAPLRKWQANPYWVKTHLHQRDEIKNYLTLTGGEREIELGRFLQPKERAALRRELDQALAKAKSA